MLSHIYSSIHIWNPISYLKSSVSTEGKKTLSFLQTSTPHLFPQRPGEQRIYIFFPTQRILVPAFALHSTPTWFRFQKVHDTLSAYQRPPYDYKHTSCVMYNDIHIFSVRLYKNVERHSRLVWYVSEIYTYIHIFVFQSWERSEWWSSDPPILFNYVAWGLVKISLYV